MRLALSATAVAVALCTCASAQQVPPAAPSPSKPADPAAAAQPPIANDTVAALLPAAACCRLAAGVVVELELAQEVSTKTVKSGDHFAVRLATPVVVDGQVLAPAGASGGLASFMCLTAFSKAAAPGECGPALGRFPADGAV